MAKKNMIHDIVIDRDKCIGCGACVRDCVSQVLTLEKGKAVYLGPECIVCGHCEAICPQGAVMLTGFEDRSVEYAEQTRLDPELLLDAIRTRRSIRVFEDKSVPDILTDRIIEAGRLAPSACNDQDTGFVILGSKQDELEDMAAVYLKKLARTAGLFVPILRNKNAIGDNFFFKKAPLAIAVTGSKINASLAAENMAFMAEAQGLGVLFSGFFTVCANRCGAIRKVMGLGKKDKVVTTLVIGYPAVRYRRTARREKAKVRKL